MLYYLSPCLAFFNSNVCVFVICYFTHKSVKYFIYQMNASNHFNSPFSNFCPGVQINCQKISRQIFQIAIGLKSGRSDTTPN